MNDQQGVTRDQLPAIRAGVLALVPESPAEALLADRIGTLKDQNANLMQVIAGQQGHRGALNRRAPHDDQGRPAVLRLQVVARRR